jgi:hypothetical protein
LLHVLLHELLLQAQCKRLASTTGSRMHLPALLGAAAVCLIGPLCCCYAQEAKHNVELCKGLLQRCNRLHRILAQHPDNLERIDQELLARLFEFLNRANDLIKCVAVALLQPAFGLLLLCLIPRALQSFTGTTARSLQWADCCEREA